MSLSDANRNLVTDEIFLTAYADKCKKIGGKLNEMNVCQIPRDYVATRLGPDACERQLNGTLSADVCSLDRSILEHARIESGAFEALLVPVYLYSIGEYTRFSAQLQKELEQRGIKLTRDNELVRGLLVSHLFEINNDVKEMLVRTATPKSNDMLHLPFETMFIDVSFKKDELRRLGVEVEMDEIHGILIQKAFTYPSIKGVQLDDRAEIKEDRTKSPIRACINLSYYGVKDKKPYFETSSAQVNLWEGEPSCPVPDVTEEKPKILTLKESYRKTQRFVHLFSLNVINFINNREIEIVPVKYDRVRNVDRRIAEHKLPIPQRSVIKLTGSVKQYVQEYHDHPQWHYGFSFHVHGHFRKFRSERYSEDVRGTTIWIPEFIKGKGSLVEKAYILDKKKHGAPEDGVNIVE